MNLSNGEKYNCMGEGKGPLIDLSIYKKNYIMPVIITITTPESVF